MLRIAIIVGSTRPGRRSREIAEWVLAGASRRDDATFELLDLADFDLPHLDEPISAGYSAALGVPYSTPHAQVWSDAVSAFDGFVVVAPEYNHSIPGVLKDALDFLHPEWNDKAAGIVAYGAAEGIRAGEQLRLIFAELAMPTVRQQVGLSFFADFQDGVFVPGELRAQQLDTMLDQLVRWSRALAPLRSGAEV